MGTHSSRASKPGCERRRGLSCERGGRDGLHLYLSRVCVQGVPGQTLCPEDTPELSLQPLKEVLPLWAQQEAGAARVLQTQHVTANAAQQALQKLLSCLAGAQGSAELQGHRAPGAGLGHKKGT